MVPEFNSNGVLPPGQHDATLDDVRSKYTYNSHRLKLFNGFLKGVNALKKAGCRKIFLDGSYITDKNFPNDFDACWDTQNVNIDFLKTIEPTLFIFANKRAAQKAKFYGEFFPAQALATSTSPFRTFLDFFQIDKHSGKAKGIIRITF